VANFLTSNIKSCPATQRMKTVLFFFFAFYVSLELSETRKTPRMLSYSSSFNWIRLFIQFVWMN